ncbi:MAG: ABC transporter ATP-binding protein [Bdellovibrionales bacterium]
MKFQLKDVGLKLGTSQIFQNINVTFEGPGTIALLGPSGCGKSTLIRVLSGLQPVSTGSVSAPQGRQAFVFQESHLLNWRRAVENVHLPLELGSNPRSDLEHALRALEDVGLKSAAALYPAELSGGMKMRVSLARAFVTKPNVLFCDEPFSALDETTRENLQIQLRSLVERERLTCFFVSHSLSEALAVADVIYHFQGRGEISPIPFKVQRQPLPAFRESESFHGQLKSLKGLIHRERP